MKPIISAITPTKTVSYTERPGGSLDPLPKAQVSKGNATYEKNITKGAVFNDLYVVPEGRSPDSRRREGGSGDG